MIRTIRPLDRLDPGLERVAKANGFSLHAGVSCEGHQSIAQQINPAFGLDLDKDIIRRVLAIHYKPDPSTRGPS